MKLHVAHRPIKLLVAAAIMAVLVVFFGLQALNKESSAADIRNFDPGNIMSDAVMSDSSTMSVQDIQNFLNSKNYCDNQNIHMAAWYPNLQYSIKDGRFVCMARENFNGKSAAQLIWEAGQEFSINPQVLIVLLEKEQGLVSDTWPNHVQYRTATGFGCPDTAPCDSQYYGLENQLKQAAKLFRTVLNGGWSNYPVGQRYVQYHPNAACGGSIVNIQNRATSALYRYTPYQPNKSALEAGYGTGDSCGAYGNRNFWRLFTDWFGSTQGYNWKPLEEVRWMQVSVSLQKIDLSNGKPIGDTIQSGRHIKFIDKTTINGVTYLRTESDYVGNIARGIPHHSLQEIEYEKIVPVWRIVNFDGVHKFISRQQDWAELGNPSFQFPAGTIVKVVDSVTVNGRVSYRTEFDSKHGNDLAFTEDRLSPLGSLLPLDHPRNMQVKTETTPIKIDGSPCVTLKRFDILQIKGKAIIGGAMYFSDKQSATSPDDFCFITPSDLHWNAIDFNNFDDPREMRLARDAVRINAYTGEAVDILKAGRVIHFSTKTVLGNVSYFRTTYGTERNEPYVVPASALVEVY